MAVHLQVPADFLMTSFSGGGLGTSGLAPAGLAAAGGFSVAGGCAQLLAATQDVTVNIATTASCLRIQSLQVVERSYYRDG